MTGVVLDRSKTQHMQRTSLKLTFLRHNKVGQLIVHECCCRERLSKVGHASLSECSTKLCALDHSLSTCIITRLN
jgi:hypothetical protein